MTQQGKREMIDWIKIVSLWGSSLVVAYQIGVAKSEIFSKLIDHENRITANKKEIDDLKDWKKNVTAYYYPKTR